MLARVVREEAAVVLRRKLCSSIRSRVAAKRKVAPRISSSSSAVTGKKRIWSKKRSSQGLPARTRAVCAVGVPHLDRAADELVAARAFHAIDAQIGAADADGVLRRPGAGGVVLGRDQPMARIDRRGDRRAEVNVAQAEHQIAGVEHDALARRRSNRGR